MGLTLRTLGFTAGPAPGEYATVSFAVVQTPLGTSPTAEVPDDTLLFTSDLGSVDITGNASLDTINFDLNLTYLFEAAQDAVGSILTDTATIDFNYDDGIPSITADVIQSGINHTMIGSLVDGDSGHTQFLLLAGRAGGPDGKRRDSR